MTLDIYREMIIILPNMYVISIIAGALLCLAYMGCVTLRKSQRLRLSLLIALIVCVLTCVFSAALLSRFTQSFNKKAEMLPRNSSKAEVLAMLGSPTKMIEPANGANQIPMPGTAVWHYEVKAWPFELHGRMEFMDDKLIK